MTLCLYLSRLLLGRFVVALGGLAALLLLLDLLERTGDVLARGGASEVLHYALLRLPSILSLLVPLAALLGALLAFRHLAAALEWTAIRASGIGWPRIVLLLAPAALLMGGLQLGLAAFVAPASERRLAEWWDAGAPDQAPRAGGQPLWFRTGADLVSVGAVARDAATLTDVQIFERDTGGRLLARTEAARALHGEQGWMLEQVRIVRPGQPRTVEASSLAWPDGPAPAVLRRLARSPDAIGVGALVAGAEGAGAVARGHDFYATRLQALGAAIFAPMVMLLLALPVAHALPRQGGSWRRIGVGSAMGLLFLLSAGLLRALGEVGGVAPVAAAWSPSALFVCVALALLWREEA